MKTESQTMALLELPPNSRRFLAPNEDAVYTVIDDGSKEYILISNSAYGEVKIEGTSLTKEILLKKYNIDLTLNNFNREEYAKQQAIEFMKFVDAFYSQNVSDESYDKMYNQFIESQNK